nr:MAG TPA: hypothetical protein [Caudoviricetes sp.]
MSISSFQFSTPKGGHVEACTHLHCKGRQSFDTTKCPQTFFVRSRK